MNSVARLENEIGIIFDDQNLLHQALIHSSYLNENPSLNIGSNERLEFLGDSVLGLVVTEEIYRLFPSFSEGELTRMRAALVQSRTLARLASSLHLGDYLCMGKGEEQSGGRGRLRTLACAFEALLAAIYLDRGLAVARDFVLRLLAPDIEQAGEHHVQADYKSRLQELVQKKWQVTPSYRTVAEEGPDHSKTFTVQVLAGKQVLGEGTARSKQSAEKRAAREALERLLNS